LIILSVYFYFSVSNNLKKKDFEVAGEIIDVLPE